MPTRVLTIGTTEASIYPNPARTVMIIQNLDTTLTDYIYISDERGKALTHGLRIAGQGGSITLRKIDGEEPEKEWRIVATTASTPVRLTELYGEVHKVVVEYPYPPPEPTPTPPPEEPVKYWWQ